MWLKQSTVTVIPFGPFVDKGDGVTLETAVGIITSIDHATTGIMLSKNGGTLAVREQGGNFVASTYDAHGCFKVSLSAVDTGALGGLRVIHTEPATYLAVWQDFMVVPANVWDSMFGADKLDVNVEEQANIDFGALQKASITASLIGTGLVEHIYTVTNSVTGNPESGVTVIMSTDLLMANPIHRGSTDALGQVHFWPNVPVGTTVYLWRFKTGFGYSNPDTEVTHV